MEDKKWNYCLSNYPENAMSLLNELSYEEIRDILLKTDSEGNSLVSYLAKKNIAWLDYVRSPDVVDFLCAKNVVIDFNVLQQRP